jgi:hypothetical protein
MPKIGFQENGQYFFQKKIAKVAKVSDYNIDPGV